MNKIELSEILKKKDLRILVTRTDRMGDVVLTTPVFRAIKERYPESYVAALVQPTNQEIVENNPYIDEVIAYDKRGEQKHWWQSLMFAAKLKAKQFDVALHIHPTNRVHCMSWFARIPVRIGYNRKWGHLLTHVFPEGKRKGERHEALYNFDVLRTIDISAPHEIVPEMYVTAEHEAHFDAVLGDNGIVLAGRPLIAMNPGASCPSKVWPAERFARLADQLIEEYHAQVVLIGDSATRVIADNIRRYMRHAYIDLVGKLNLKDLACLFKRVDCLISNDTGPVHIASAVGAPVVSLFGRSEPGLSPERWRPLGERSFYLHKPQQCGICRAHNCEHGFECLNNIHVTDVLQLMREHPAFFPWAT